MKNFLSCYKYFKSFKIPVLKEDHFEVELSLNDQPLDGKFTLKNINLNYFSLSSNFSIETGNELEIKLIQKKLFLKKDVSFTAKVMNSYLGEDKKSHMIIFETNSENYQKYVQDYILSFNKKRLKNYLIKSSLEDMNYNNEEVAEIVTLLKMGFQNLLEKYDNNLDDLLDESRSSIKSENANLYLINTSNNTLEKKYSTLKDAISTEEDYRKGIPGIVFTTGEIVNIYNSRYMEFFNDNEPSEPYLAFPLYNRFKDIIGVLEYKNKTDDKRFSKKDEDVGSFMSVLFSSFFQLYKPVHPSSKIESFNPGLKKDIHRLQKESHFKESLYAIQKVKGQLESILINSCDQNTLKIVVDEIIDSSHAYDWERIYLDCKDENSSLNNLNDKSILIIQNVESSSDQLQSDILDLIDNKKIWLVSTYLGKEIDTGLFSSDFQRAIARHHIDFYSSRSDEELEQVIEECVHSMETLEGFDKKVQSFEEVINQVHQIPFPKDDKTAA